MFNEKLRKLRESKKLTQTELSTLLNLSQNAISQYELKKREPSLEILIKIADFFEVSIDFLLDRMTLEYYNVFKKSNNLGISAQQLDKAIDFLNSKVS